MKKNGIALPLALAGFVALASPLAAQELSDDDFQSAAEFAVNNSQYVLYHEIGHMLVHQFGLPILGREEDAADNIATYSLLAQESDAADTALVDSAYGWLLSDAMTQSDEYEAADFYDEHSLDPQRAYAIVCLMVGNDPEGFASVANEYELDADRQDRCIDTYGQFEASLGSLLSPHLGQGAKITVSYESAGAEYEDARALLENSGIMEAAAQDIGTSFALPNPIAFVGRECGEPNAYYDPQEAEVVMCYELMDDYVNMIITDMLEGEEEGA